MAELKETRHFILPNDFEGYGSKATEYGPASVAYDIIYINF